MIQLQVMTDEEAAERDAWWERRLTLDALHRLEAQLCEDERRGHVWQLDIDPDDGCHLSCLYCPADVNDVYPDGGDVMTGEFEVYPGYVLSLDSGLVRVNGELRDRFWGWRGLVTARLWVEEYRSYWEPPEYDVWVIVEPA